MKHPPAADDGRPARAVGRRLSALAARYAISTDGAAQLACLLSLLARDPLAPTRIRTPSRVLDDHLADSLVALELEQIRTAGVIADLGAGAGIPGLPLAVAMAAAEVVMIESNRRKCGFIERVIALCEITNASVICTRAEAWREGLGRCDLVTARALASLPVVAEYGAPLLRVGGALLVWRGRRDPAEEASGARAAAQLGLETQDLRRVEPYPGAINRHLQLLIKVEATPERFPRRPGVARKRPLGNAEARAV